MSEQQATAGGIFMNAWTLGLGAEVCVPRPTVRERLRTFAARVGILLAFMVAMVAAAVALPGASVPLGIALLLAMMVAQVRLVPAMWLRFHERGIAGRFRAEGWFGLMVSRRIIPYASMTSLELRGDTLSVEIANARTGRRSRATGWVAPSQRGRVGELVEAANRAGLVGRTPALVAVPVNR